MAKKKSKAKSSRVPATKEPKKKSPEKRERPKPMSLAPLTFDEAMEIIVHRKGEGNGK